MNLEETYQNIINELQGISPQGRAWAHILLGVLKEMYGNGEKTTLRIVLGKRYPEPYKNFPVDLFYLEKAPGYGYYNETKSGYDKDGRYRVYMSISNNKDDSNIVTTLNHELRHAFEDYCKKSKGKPGISDSKEFKQFYAGDFEKMMKGEIKGDFTPFIYMFNALYLTSKIEASAMAENIYDNKHLGILKELKSIKGRNYLKGLDDKKVQKNWNDLKSKVKIPILDKFNDYMMFVKWADKTIQIRADKVYKKLIKVRYLSDMQQKGGV